MKSRLFYLIPAAAALSLVTWSAIALAADPAGRVASATAENPAAERAAALSRMEAAQATIIQRLCISAPMELELENGVDPVAEARGNGLILDVSLEQVEAALAAAAKTPELEDDQRAMNLKHWGSYRFYGGDVADESPPSDVPPASNSGN